MLTQTATLASLTSFDWFLVIVAALSTLFAMMKGFIRVLFSLIGLAAGTLLASWDYLPLAVWLQRWIVSRPASEAVAFLAILSAVTIAFGIAAAVVRKGVRAVGLGFMDRLLGAGVGLVRGVLLGVATMMTIAAFIPNSTWIRNSLLAPYFLAGAHAVSFVVPQHFQQQMADGTRHLVRKTPMVLQRNLPPQ
jgi:membrane protein required for colicin V production